MKKLIYIISILFALASCDVLDLKPLDKISEVDTWSDPALMQLYVNANYNAIRHGFVREVLAAASDESYCIHNHGSILYVQRGDLTSDNVSHINTVINYWSHAYSYLRDINIYLNKIEDVDVDEEFRKTTTGEMKFLRSYIYANLIWRYGGVPLITRVYELNEDYGVTRNSYDDCVEFIIKELDEAISLLPARQSAAELGRASGDACKALKARVLLYAASLQNNPTNEKSRWERAEKATAELLNAGYELYPDYQELFLKDNSEIIFARYFTQASNSEYSWINGRGGSGGGGSQCPTQNLVNAYEMAATGIRPYTENADGTITFNTASGYDPQKPFTGLDPRFEATILYDGSIWAGRETETFHEGLDSPEYYMNGTLTGYCLKKFMVENIPPVGSSEKPTNPWIFFRYGEILLNYAEILFELGDESGAREYLNKIRERQSVQMPPVTDSGDKLRDRIRNERRIELAFEEHRFYDVRRWKIAEETESKDLLAMDIWKQTDGSKTYGITSLLKRNFPEALYLLPIPRTEIDKSLNTLTQNTGY